jgi:hypothetical protein
VATHVDVVELRVVVAKVLAVAADAVLVAQHLLKIGAHLAIALACLHVHNIARRSSLEAESTREKKGGDERRNVRNSVWKFGTGNRKCRRLKHFATRLPPAGPPEANAKALCRRRRRRNCASAAAKVRPTTRTRRRYIAARTNLPLHR